MIEARPRPRLTDVLAAEPALHSRAELVRYFAWGYLSRRELNERLDDIEGPPPRRLGPSHRRGTRSAA